MLVPGAELGPEVLEVLVPVCEDGAADHEETGEGALGSEFGLIVPLGANEGHSRVGDGVEFGYLEGPSASSSSHPAEDPEPPEVGSMHAAGPNKPQCGPTQVDAQQSPPSQSHDSLLAVRSHFPFPINRRLSGSQ